MTNSPTSKTGRVSWLELKQLVRLSVPILLAQLALTGLGVVDTIMSGQVGTDDLAAIGLGSSLLLPVFMIATGVLLALTPIIARQKGREAWGDVTQFLHQAIWLSIPLGLFSLFVLMHLQWVLDWLTLPPAVYHLTDDYLFYIAFGLPGIALYQAFRFFWEGLGLTVPTMIISGLALVMNIPLNALFIYGWGPIEAYGAAGCGIASAIVMWTMLLMAVLYVLASRHTSHLVALRWRQFGLPSWQNGIRDLLALGVPNTLALLFEISLFSFIALFIAKLGAVVIAAHQVAISFTSMVFMIPLSASMAITVRTGLAYGQGSLQALKQTLTTGIGFSGLVSLLTASLTYGLAYQIASLYSPDAEVIALAASLLGLAALYQFFDAVQVACAGALRGLHSTRIIMVVTFVSYWLIGLGLGYALAFGDWFWAPQGVVGFWIGILLGLTLAAILLSLNLRQRIRYLVTTGELQ
ncbi:MATE family efflux transporter [Thiomicrospira sp. XS5]|uniref:MATE family efflux transporter n=1 Tax=Thiomicrospira sp. XS5 TaxID=1775636 RepID=UPI000748B3FD|nr:MATE family efflux transporter [Thiomicrospira sp. XS5]KUJ75403.1 MATE family efflux transporter [Thiomicrospira sp. XS5]